MSIFHYQTEADNKENYNPDLKTFSPQRLVNQKRYKVLKSIVMKNQKYVESSEILALKERNNMCKEEMENVPSQSSGSVPDGLHALETGCLVRDLEFEDETERKFGL